MRKDGDIVSYTIDELRAMRERGEDLTDWDRVRALTDDEVEASIDFDEEGDFDWENVIVGIPGPKRQITLRLDGDIVDEFKSRGSGYQTRINNVLRAYVNACRLHEQRTRRR